MSEKEKLPVARAVLQQCLHARLQVKPAEQDSEAQFVEVSTGDWCHGCRLMVCVCVSDIYCKEIKNVIQNV